MTTDSATRVAAQCGPGGSPRHDLHIGPVMTRVAGLSSAVMDGVVPDIGDLLSWLAEADRTLDELAPRLTDLLYALVPTLDDDIPLRRRVLAGRRAINKHLDLGWTPDVHQRLNARIDTGSAALVARWSELVASRAHLLASLDAELTAHRVDGVASLRRALRAEGLMPSLAVAAPDWVRYGKFEERRLSTARDLRTLYSYVARAGLKTSPFSGLTTVGAAGTTGRGRSRSRTSATVAYLALLRLAHVEATARLLTYRVAPVRPGGTAAPGGLLLHSELVIAAGTVWRNDRVVEADHAARWIDAIDPGGRGRVSYPDLIAAVGGSQPFARFLRLLDTGVIQPIPPWKQGRPPLPALARLVRGRESPISHADLILTHGIGARVVELGTDARVDAALTIRRMAAAWTDADGRGQDQPGGLIYEDRETDLQLPDPRSIPPVVADLAVLGSQIRPAIFRSHVYDFLVERFVAEFGAGGVCGDPLGFLMRLAVDGDANPPLDAATFADIRARAEPGERAWLPVGPTSAPPTAGVLLQLEAADHEDVEAGRYRMVVNHFSSGTGGLLSRFGSLLGNDFRCRLAAYVEQCWPSMPCRELVVWTECNTVQAECAGLLPPLLVAGEVDADDAITVDETTLAHDADSNTLALCGMDGTPFGLVYLGLIPQHLLQSYVRLLAVLADPWINASRQSDYTMGMAHELRACVGDEVVELPRIETGRIVTRRASWIVPVADLPRGDAGGDADLAVRLDRYRQAHQLPDEVFVHQLGSSAFTGAGDRKPMWISLTSPLSWTVLWQWLSPGTSHVRLVEVLPARHLNPQRDGHGGRRVTEQATLISWPRPEGDAP